MRKDSSQPSLARQAGLTLSLIGGLMLSTAAAPVAAADATPAATPAVAGESGRLRINLASRLRVLAQQVAAASCRVAAGHDLPGSQIELAGARDDFNRIFTGLVHGDDNLGVRSREDDPYVKDRMTALLKAWAPTSVAINKVLSNQSLEMYSLAIAENTAALDKETQHLLDEMVAEYSNPHELVTADALTISLAGRQSKLAQQLSRETCGVLTDQPHYGTADQIVLTEATFDATINAMADGMPSAGIVPPPSEHVAQAIHAAILSWSDVKTGGNTIGDNTLTWQANLSDTVVTRAALRDEMDAIVGMYMLSSPQQTERFRETVTVYAEAEIEGWISDRVLVEDALAAANLDAPTKSDSAALLRSRLLATAGLIVRASAYAADGTVFALTDAQDIVEMPDDIATYFARDGIGIGEVYWDAELGTHVSEIMLPIYRNGEIVGGANFTVDVAFFL